MESREILNYNSDITTAVDNSKPIITKKEFLAVISARVVCPCCDKAIWIKVEQTTSNQEID